MSQGYIDPITKKYIKTAGNASIENLPTGTDKDAGLMSVEDKKKLDTAYTTDDVASAEIINSLFE